MSAGGWPLRALVALLALAAAAESASFAVTSPVFSSADESAHLDYAYQVWIGRLPVFEDGLAIEPPFGQRPPSSGLRSIPPSTTRF